MSRIGNNPIKIPSEVKVVIEPDKIHVDGKLGKLSQSYIGVNIEINDDILFVKRNSESKESRSKHGLYRALIFNMVQGVNVGYTKELELVGVESLNLLRTETGCEIVAMDLFESKSAVDLYKIAEKKFNGLDVLVNGAAMNKRKVPIADIDLSEWEVHMALNLRAPMLLCREAMRHMSEGGHIMNIVSSIALTSQINYSIYAATKYALMGFTNTLRKEAQLKGIKVTAAFPGGTDTNFRQEERLDYMRPESAALMLVHALEAPEDVVMHELVYRPMIETNF